MKKSQLVLGSGGTRWIAKTLVFSRAKKCMF
jgi:hypothetical protein